MGFCVKQEVIEKCRKQSFQSDSGGSVLSMCSKLCQLQNKACHIWHQITALMCRENHQSQSLWDCHKPSSAFLVFIRENMHSTSKSNQAVIDFSFNYLHSQFSFLWKMFFINTKPRKLNSTRNVHTYNDGLSCTSSPSNNTHNLRVFRSPSATSFKCYTLNMSLSNNYCTSQWRVCKIFFFRDNKRNCEKFKISVMTYLLHLVCKQAH